MRILLTGSSPPSGTVTLRRPDDEGLLVKAGTVIDADGVRAGHDVFVRGDRIEEVSPAVDFPSPTFDASETFVIPGLVDLWADLVGDSIFAIARGLRDLLHLGTTTAHLPAVRGSTGLALRQAMGEGLLTGPRILLSASAQQTKNETEALVELRRSLGLGADLVRVDDDTCAYSRVAVEVAGDLGRPVLHSGGRGADARAVVDTAIRDGNPLQAALARATSEPARTIGLDDQIGLIAPGMLAELVIVRPPTDSTTGLFDGPPLAVIHAGPDATWQD